VERGPTIAVGDGKSMYLYAFCQVVQTEIRLDMLAMPRKGLKGVYTSGRAHPLGEQYRAVSHVCSHVENNGCGGDERTNATINKPFPFSVDADRALNEVVGTGEKTVARVQPTDHHPMVSAKL
jgi:hypothetical protein